jgi:hypothetical protein
MEAAHSKTTEECLAYFGVSETTGLTPDQVKRHLEKYGPNGKWPSRASCVPQPLHTEESCSSGEELSYGTRGRRILRKQGPEILSLGRLMG